MIVTLDTNVLFQALYSPSGSSGFILQLFGEGKITAAISESVWTEYQDVLLRPTSLAKFNMSVDDVTKFLLAFPLLAKRTKIHFSFRPNLRDEAGNMILELAVHSQSRFLITNNIRDFTILKELIFDDVTIIKPSDFVKWWRMQNE